MRAATARRLLAAGRRRARALWRWSLDLPERPVLGVRGAGVVIAGLATVVAVSVLIGLVGLLHAISIDHRIHRLSASLQVAQAQAEAGQFGAAQATLNHDEREFVGINSALSSSPDFRLLGAVPLLGRNIDAVRSASHLGLSLIDDARQVVVAAQEPGSTSGKLGLSLRGGQAPVALIQRLRTTIATIIPTLPSSPAPPHDSLLVGPVSRARSTLWSEAYQRRRELQTIEDSLGVLNDLVGAPGPRSYLVAVANTAEMRGAGGMILSYGVLDADNGHLSLGDFGNIDKLLLSRPAPAQFPADYQRYFSAYDSNELWRNATIMSDFTVDAPVLESMYTQATGKHVNGVVQIDPAGLGAILAGIGPVHDPLLGNVTAQNVVPLTLNTAYLAFPNRPQRKEFLAGVAQECFAALTSRPVSLGPLIAGLSSTIADRHIVMYSSTPGIEPLIHDLGAAGAMPGPGQSFEQLTIQNMGGNKLDFYVHSQQLITGTAPTATTPGEATISAEVLNEAPLNGKAGLVFGPLDPSSGDPPGTYRGLVTVYVPKGAVVLGTALGAHGQQLFENTQNGLTAVTWYIVLHAGQFDTTSIKVRLPPDPAAPGTFTVVPTPRIIPTQTLVRLKGN